MRRLLSSLSSLRERLALKANLWTQSGGPLLILGTVAAIELLSRRLLKIPNPPAILLLVVVFSAFVGGLRSGLVSAVIAWMYFAYFFSISGQPFHYTDENLRRVMVWAVTTPCMAIMVGILKRRTERTFEISKANALLTMQITERELTEQALRDSEEKFSKAFDASPDAVVISRQHDGLMVDVNQATEKLFGYSRAEFIGKTSLALGLFADPADRERVVGLLKQKGFLRDFELQLRTRRGEVRNVLISSDQIEFAGTPHILTIVRDITTLKRAEEDRLAKEAAEQASRAKSEFLSRMSHELRTPLNAILGFGQLLELDVSTPDQRESVEQILKAGRHLLDLINEILDIARIEAGRLSLSIEPVALQEVVEECLDLIRPAAVQRRTVLDQQTSMHDLIVMADRQRLKQVLLNLLSNAVKFNTEGGRVMLSCEHRPHERLRVSVADTGPGISPADLPRLFTPFERLRAQQTGVEGTGLGLALSKTLMDVMQGAIGVESTVGRGSTFWIELPIAEGAALEPKGAEPAAAAAAGVPAAKAASTVLYIEDNLSNLKLLEHVMARRPDVRLLTAMQGRLGLDLARQHHPDLILLDLDLPDVRGDQILRILRDDAATMDIPVVMLTATATPGEIGRLLADGARAYLTKPFDIRALFQMLDEIAEE